MKRGLFNWDKGELSEQVLENRKKAVLEKMKAEDLQFLLIHGDVYQCDDVQFLCNFNTYTRDCLLIVSRNGDLSLVSGLTLRDRKWIETVTPVMGEKIFFGIGLLKGAEVIKQGGFFYGKLGLVGDFFPRVTLKHLKKEFPQATFQDLTDWYRNLRRSKDSDEKKQIKRAALIAMIGAKALDSPDVFGRSEINASAHAEWAVRSRGGEDFFLMCSTGPRGYLDFPGDVSVVDRFAFSILAQYKGCWATLQRTAVSMDIQEREKEHFEAYVSLMSNLQSESSLKSLDQSIEKARSGGWQVEIKAPIGQDTSSSVISSMDRIPTENDSVFSLSFRKETEAGLFIYGETIYIGREGYEVWTQ